MRMTRGRVAIVAAAIFAGVLAVVVSVSRSETQPQSSGHSPAQLTVNARTTQPFEYVASVGAVYVYSIDRGNRLVQKISLPQIGSSIHGMVVSPRTARLYISSGPQQPPGGRLLAHDLRRGRILWNRTYSFGIDSMAFSRDGRWIYLPAGEKSPSGAWRVIAASSGRPTGATIDGPAGAHNTVMGPDGRFLYLGGVDYPYL